MHFHLLHKSSAIRVCTQPLRDFSVSGNMLAKELSFLANADAAGIVLGARVPIILTSRADSVRAHMASCAVAALCVRAEARITT